jgi:hypothetical protein
VFEQEGKIGMVVVPDTEAVGRDDLAPLPGTASLEPPLFESTIVAGALRSDPGLRGRTPQGVSATNADLDRAITGITRMSGLPLIGRSAPNAANEDVPCRVR